MQFSCVSCSVSYLLHPQRLNSLDGLLKVFAWAVLSPLRIWLSLRKDPKNSKTSLQGNLVVILVIKMLPPFHKHLML